MLVATLCAWNLLLLINNTLAFPRSSSSVSRLLESRGSSITVPSCADSCVQTLIQQSFPTCAQQQDLNCLCTTRSLTGYTIGEDILQCVISDCADATSDQLSQAYSICNSIPNAVQPTHATITANIATETTIFADPPSASTSSAAVAASSITSIPTTLITSSSSSPQNTAAASTSSTISSTPSTATPIINPTLPKSSIIGISVGLGVLALIAMALLSYICCCRRRDRRESAQSYEATKQPLISKNEVTSASFPAPPSRTTNPYVPSKAQSFLGQKYPGWSPMSTSNQATSPYTALAVTPRDERSITPSAATYQTTSRLLPEKPSFQSPPPRPARERAEEASLTRPSAAQTRASPSRFGASPDSFDTGRVMHRRPSDPFLQVPAPRYNPSRDTAESQRMNLPKLNTKSVSFVPEPQAPSATQQRRSPVPYNPASYAHFAETETPNWRTPVSTQTRNANIIQPGLALTTETAVPVQTRSTLNAQPSTSRSPETAFNKYKPIPPPKTRHAASTITSFESEGDEDTPAVPPLAIWKKPVLASTSPNVAKQSHQQYQPVPQSQPSSATAVTPLSRVQYPAVPTITMTPISSSTETPQSLPFNSEGNVNSNQPYGPYTSSMDVSRLLDRGFVELPERNSGLEWIPVKLVSTPSLQASNFGNSAIPHDNVSTYPNNSSIRPRTLIPAPPKQQPAPKMLVELPSPDAERLADPIAQAGEQLTSRSPKSESRGARLGAAIASKTPQARPRGNSESNMRIPLPSAPKMGHMRSRSHAVDMKPQTVKSHRPLNEIGLEPAARRQIQLRNDLPY